MTLIFYAAGIRDDLISVNQRPVFQPMPQNRIAPPSLTALSRRA
jgi:hypothetical protein